VGRKRNHVSANRGWATRPSTLRGTSGVPLRFEQLEPRLVLDGGPIITELMAVNDSVLADQDGDFSDWIELHNPGNGDVYLDGWHLSDEPANLDKWEFPAVTLHAGEYLVVFASEKDRTDPGNELHTNFNLDGNGEYLALVEPDGQTVAQQFAPAFPPQHGDVSFGVAEGVLANQPIAAGSDARTLIPENGSLGLTWTGKASDEPFDDSLAAGWIQGNTGIGYDTGSATAGQTELVGHAPINRPYRDVSLGEVIILESSAFTQPGELVGWTVYADVARTITPLILQVDAGGDHTITGIGRPRTTVASGGQQQFAFSVQSGSAEVGSGYFFGFKHGTDGTDETGAAPYTQNAGDSVRSFGQQTNFAAGDDLGRGTPLVRTYSVQATSVIADSQPQAYWTFDEGVADVSGNGHHGRLFGAGFSSDVPPVLGFGKSAQFDGANDYISATINVSETAYTTSLWFKSDSDNRGIFAVVDSDLGAGGHDRHLYLTNGNVATRTWSDETIVTSGLDVADGNWHHLVHVVGSEIDGQRLYVDGQLAVAGSKALSDFDWQRQINIGFSNDAAGGYFQGRIDDVAVWDSVLTEPQIRALSQGASPMALAGYQRLIATDVDAAMHDVNPSAYVRVPFQVASPAEVEGEYLRLRMQYDDGFVAWLNGVEIARRNAPQTLAYNATATTDRSQIQAIAYEEINLPGAMELLRPGTNVLAIQGLNDAVDSDDFLVVTELVQIAQVGDRYLTAPTPGEANGGGVTDFVADTQFSIDRGFFTDPLQVEITTATDGAEIYFTTDGSLPSPENPEATRYTSAISIGTTTTLRAMARKDDYEPTDVDTQTYVFPAQVANQPAHPPGLPSTWSGGFPADYQVDPDVVGTTLPGYSLEEALLSIPTVSVTANLGDLFGASQGIYYNSGNKGSAWERPASIEMIYPDGTGGFQENAGIRIHGGSSRNHGFTPKHSLRLFFRDEYGASKLNFPVFGDRGIDRFDQLVLRACSTDSWPVVDGNWVLGVQRWKAADSVYMRDQWVRDTQLDLGRPSADGVYVHLYLNGLYWGVYNLAERPTDSFNAEHVGGDRDEYDVVHDFVELQSGNKNAWNQMIAMAAAGLGSETAYQRIQGNNPDGSRNDAYPVYLDVGNLIDYMIVHIYAGAEDWPDHNWWGARRRGPESEGFKFFAWDQEISNDSLVRTHTRISTRFENPISSQSPSYLYGQCMANETFRWKFRDRVHELLFNDGLLTTAQNDARWIRRADEIDQAMVGESARWGDSKRSVPYRREVEWLGMQRWMHDIYWPQVHEIALQRFKNVGLYPDVVAPQFTQHGGQVPAGLEVAITAPDGAIYYTLDGSDPMLSDGSISPDARPYVSVLQSVKLIDRGAEWKFLDDGPIEGTAWRELDFGDGDWKSGFAEFGYGDGDEATVVDYGPDPANKHVTTYFRHRFYVHDVAGTNELLLRLIRDDGAVMYLNGQEITPRSNMPDGTITPTTPALMAVNGEFERLWHEIVSEASLLQAGWNVLAVEVHQRTANSGDLSFDLELQANTISSPTPVTLAESTILNSRVLDSGGWSALNSATFLVEGPGPLQIVELNYHPHDPTTAELAALPPGPPAVTDDDFEFIELQNTGSETLDLSGVRFADGVDFAFADGTTLDPGQYVVVVRNELAFEARYGTGVHVAGSYDDGLSNSGETIELVDRFGQTIARFKYDDGDGWPGRADGKGASLELIDPDAVPPADPQRSDYLGDADHWRSCVAFGGTPGTAPQPHQGVVINEVLSHTDWPKVDSIELHNVTDQPIDVGDWYLSDSWGWESNPANGNYKKYRIAKDTTIAAGGYLVFDELQHFNRTPMDPGPYDFALDGAHGDDVWLMRADAAGKLTHFGDHVDFGAQANAESWGRWPDAEGVIYPMIEPTLRADNRGPRLGSVVITEVHYNPGMMTDANDLEFIEIYNTGTTTVDLTHWRLDKGVEYDFAVGDAIEAGGAIVIVPFDPQLQLDELAGFQTVYNLQEPVELRGPYSGQLENDGERVQLLYPDMPPTEEPDFYPGLLEDEVIYDDKGPWPTDANGNGRSLSRLRMAAWGDDAANWIAAVPTPGEVASTASIVARQVFYNRSAFDGDNAIATDKTALLPGDLATAANYTNYNRGINGLIIDVADLPQGVVPGATDFRFRLGNDDTPADWAPAPPPETIELRRDEGVGGSHRITITWADGDVRNAWLQVTVLGANLGLPRDDVFYFGNAVAESGNSASDAQVTTTDLLLARNNPRDFLGQTDVTFAYDYDRDALVNATDVLLARNNQTHFLNALRLIDLSGTVESPAIDWLTDLVWLYEFETAESGETNRSADEPAAAAVDVLMAS